MAEHRFEAVLLAGGLGTRIRSVVPNLPKAMMVVGGRPFLEILIEELARKGVSHAILATGYLHEAIERHFGNHWGGVDLTYSVESRPLGTGGAIRKALGMACRHDVFVFNADTFFDISLVEFNDFHQSMQADVSLALKPLRNFDRYGSVLVTGGRITAFLEKRKTGQGLINGGSYLVNRHAIERIAFPEVFSFETDFLEKKTGEITIGGFVRDAYFIDIGIPEDYELAQKELPGFQRS